MAIPKAEYALNPSIPSYLFNLLIAVSYMLISVMQQHLIFYKPCTYDGKSCPSLEEVPCSSHT